MPNVMYCWEAGAALGHVSVFLPIAKRLRARGWKVTFAVPLNASKAEAAVRLLEAHGFQYVDAPGSAATLAVGGDCNCHAGIVSHHPSFASTVAFSYVLKSWLRLLEDEQPDVLVGDFALSAMLAARLKGIPRAALDLGYYYPDTRMPLPVFGNRDATAEGNVDANAKRQQVEAEVLATVNRVLTSIEATPLESFSALYESDRHLLLNFPELTTFPRVDESEYLGAMLSENGGDSPVWPSGDGGRIFAYLHGTLGAEVQTVMDALLEETKRSIVVYLPSCPDALAARYRTAHMTVTTALVDADAAVQAADLIVSNAGVGLTTRALLAGKPQLLAPCHFEQMKNSEHVVRLGAGAQIGKGGSVPEIRKLIEHLLASPMVKARARAFQYRHRPAQPDHVADLIAGLGSPSTGTRASSAVKIASKPKVRVRDCDVVFLSFDEANADANWAHLKQQVPKAKRVHGVRGFDAAHKAAAASAETERFVLVDADNRIDGGFFDLELDVPPQLQHAVWQWCSVNHVTGLAYPFGGVKIWTREVIAAMETHEACSNSNHPLALDFWAQPAYQVFSPSYSTNFTNSSPYQAFRAGFRETLKLARWHGKVKTPKDFERLAGSPHARRVSIWMSAGADVEHGYWSLLGARMGFLRCFDAEFSAHQINHYDWFADTWRNVFRRIYEADGGRDLAADGTDSSSVGGDALVSEVAALGEQIRALIKRPPVIDMSPDHSRAFRQALLGAVARARHPFTPYRYHVDFQ
jgi:UDP:flavonoid glycosyltransferase YjiC (YdhE family)